LKGIDSNDLYFIVKSYNDLTTPQEQIYLLVIVWRYFIYMTNTSSSLTTSDQIRTFQNICDKVCAEPKIRFCGVINGMGRLVAGGFKDDIKPLHNEEERKMWYMQSALEMSMKKEFGNNLGNIDHIVTYRGNVTLVNIPICDHVVLLSTERNADVIQIVEYTKELFDFNNNTRPENKKEEEDLLVSEFI